MKNIRAVISIITVIAIISVMFSGCSLFNKKEKLESNDLLQTESTTSANEDVIAPEDVTWNGDMFEAINNDGLLNILLIGQDRRPDEGRQRSDCMILCSLNPETKELSMISFLRDLYVQIPGHSDNRLNAAYVYGGFDLIKETFEYNFGVTVDGCLEVDFDSFEVHYYIDYSSVRICLRFSLWSNVLWARRSQSYRPLFTSFEEYMLFV